MIEPELSERSRSILDRLVPKLREELASRMTPNERQTYEQKTQVILDKIRANRS